ncbi:hypothetical protein CCM_03273 [Cordyceps militaris CM01]|uniref:F-box domain-containing protein n=1 Tax=Cordyceps militaris (strain CM01) TaxID=983644 RepID=G3J9S8_CORMM|nr:uncharacterized protein CCM_03273 [Cordyceps militaris CM01]EGX95001.1 hypothetical protein CCM_03273 [Cordyceps militaris CM01]
MASSVLALQLPEILSRVLSQLYSRPDGANIASALRVNKFWFACGIRILWSESRSSALASLPPTCPLAALPPTCPRRQLYAAQAITLLFDPNGSKKVHRELQYLVFPRLKCLLLDPKSLNDANDNLCPISQYFGPTLQNLESNIGSPDSDCSLSDIMWQGTYNQGKLKQHQPEDPIAVSSILRLLTRAPFLQRIALVVDNQAFFGTDFLIHCARQPQLVELALRCNHGAATWQRIPAAVPAPFPTLRALHIWSHCSAVAVLVKVVPALEELTLLLTDEPSENFLYHLQSLSALRILLVGYYCSEEIPRSELMALGELKQLRELRLRAHTLGAPPLRSKNSGFCDADLDVLLSGLGNLRVFDFRVLCSLSSKAFLKLARHCPHLQAIDILQVCNLAMNQDAFYTFPYLERFAARGFECPLDHSHSG